MNPNQSRAVTLKGRAEKCEDDAVILDRLGKDKSARWARQYGAALLSEARELEKVS